MLANSQEPVRPIDNRHGAPGVGVISFVLRVPPSLRNVIVLDASSTVRELIEDDGTIRVHQQWENTKDCSKLHVEQVHVPSGNTKMRNLSVASTHVKQIVDDVTSEWLPQNEAVLVCAVKDGKRSTIDTIRAALVASGVNLSATIAALEYDYTLRPSRAPRVAQIRVHHLGTRAQHQRLPALLTHNRLRSSPQRCT